MVDPQSLVYAQLVALVQAEPSLYDPSGADKTKIRPGTFIHYDTAVPWPDKPPRQDGDLIELTLDEDTATGNWTGFQQYRTFATNTDAIPSDWIVRGTITYLFTITGRDMRLPPVSAIRAALLLALVKGKTRLGMPQWVESWGPPTWTTPNRNLVGRGGNKRRRCDVRVPVNFNFHGSALLT